MKLRWSNGHDFEMQFEANDPESFQDNCTSALASFRTATERRVHRGEIHKTISRFESCELGVYDPPSTNWYLPSGEANALETKSFGRIEIARQFIIRANNMDTDFLDEARADCTVSLICIDPGTLERLDLSKREHSDRVWNLCVGAYQRAGNMRSMLDGFMQDLEELK
jgi:hypothetical protein